MDPARLTALSEQIVAEAVQLSEEAALLAQPPAEAGGEPFLFLFTVFVLACFIGFYVVWNVTPALHSPLMSITNAISSVIIVGGLLAAGPVDVEFSTLLGFFAVVLASVNIFGGFIVTQRMLGMFKKKR